ncbi:DENN domain-containing protein 1B isoform X2 [Clupea harengus]|uniref:DENN domain-containing protein 1B isoform X2 n=1 Tax=Clupea harengus TaxID=7950 RepID=A0A6P8F2K7_CLUHA|nr:DENN domain-containing protein 1B isoform X2 [Clupea harengus]
MGSRLRENPERTFYWFFEASCPIAKDKDPGLLFQFPDDFSDEEARLYLPRFCFPYDIERVRETVAVQHFTFVLTDLEGCQRFGFCRLTSSSETCLCILSYLPWFEVFYKLLNNLADYLTKGQTNEMRELLANLYKHPLPLASSGVTLQLIPYFIAPDPKSLPSIPESRNLTELMVAVDVGNLLQLYASMLFERRILIYSRKLSTLTACVHACSGILYPMYWQHIFIPVLPPHLLDYCCAPMPYLIGVHSSLTERVRSRALEDVVILNVDTNTMETPFDDLKKIPPDVVTALKVRLKKQSASPGCGVARAFLRAQAVLFGGYREALLYPEEGAISFSEESFLNHKSPFMRQFLECAINLQFFKQFIDSRLEQLNKGEEPDDLFEEEILQCGASAAHSKSYQQWVGNLKKGGGALLLTVKSKAHMYKSAKGHNKFGLRNILSSKDPNEVCHLQRGGSVSGTHRRNQSDCLQNRLPITQHFGRSRPRRPNRRQTEGDGNTDRQAWEDGLPAGSADGEDTFPLELEEEEPHSPLLPDPEEMDLLGEIFDTLSAQSSSERGLLYSTRSLDLFGPDSADFISRTSLATPSQESLHQSINRSGSLISSEEGLEEKEEPTSVTESVIRQGNVEDSTTNQERHHMDDLTAHWSTQKDKQLCGHGMGQREGGCANDHVEMKTSHQADKEMDGVEEGATPVKQRDGHGGKDEVRVQEKDSEQEGHRGEEQPEHEEPTITVESSKVTQETGPDTKGRSEDPGLSPDDSAQRNSPPPGVKGTSSPPEGSADGEKTASVGKSPLNQRAVVDRDAKERGNSSSPRVVMSATARFQVRDLHTRGSPEQGQPSTGSRGLEPALRKTPREAPVQYSANGLLAASIKTDNSKDDTPPVKVSELKKRFEH